MRAGLRLRSLRWSCRCWCQGRGWPLAAVLTLVVSGIQAAHGRDDFGRWQGLVQDCRIESDGRQSWSCQRLEIVQTSDTVLSLRFWRDRQDREGQRRLQVVGMMKAGEGLDCNEHGCALTPRLNLLVTGLTELQVDGRGLAAAPPTGFEASGSCQWAQRRLRCRIQGGQGPRLTITARL